MTNVRLGIGMVILCLLPTAACTTEGEGEKTLTGEGVAAIPLWLLALAAAIGLLVWWRRRSR